VLTAEQNDQLTRIEGDAPMGRMMREHSWIPACLSFALRPDGAPQRVRLLGTDYVAFRDSSGTIGFLDERCPHRNASLVLARNEDCALTCIFHAWRIDASGQVVDAPTHAPDAAAFAAKIRTPSYPVVDAGGLVWVYLGDGEAPPFPHLPFTVLPENHIWVTATKVACNWLQGVEATLDTAHIGTLHRAYVHRLAAVSDDTTIGETAEALAPRYEIDHTDYGIDAIALRPLADGTTYRRTTKWIMPTVSLVPGNAGTPTDGVIFIVSPVDDHNHVLFHGFWSYDTVISDGRYEELPPEREAMVGDRPFDVHDYGGFSGGRDDNWGQDREAMANGHFSGFTGNLIQEDTVTQVSMGPIVDRTKEHLSSSDVAIIHARRVLLRALENVADDRPPVGPGPLGDLRHAHPVDEVVPPESPVDQTVDA
jgi:nitrite reductase/ring-hydroxylating ferredoxin subunit